MGGCGWSCGWWGGGVGGGGVGGGGGGGRLFAIAYMYTFGWKKHDSVYHKMSCTLWTVSPLEDAIV